LLCLYVVLSCVGRGLCNGLITRPEESYRVSWMCDYRNPERGPMFQLETTGKWCIQSGIALLGYLVLRLYSVEWHGVKWLIGNDVEESGRDLIIKYEPRLCLKGLRKTNK
jgi:hypothetical protein